MLFVNSLIQEDDKICECKLLKYAKT